VVERKARRQYLARQQARRTPPVDKPAMAQPDFVASAAAMYTAAARAPAVSAAVPARETWEQLLAPVDKPVRYLRYL